jgi:hypothetical protein
MSRWVRRLRPAALVVFAALAASCSSNRAVRLPETGATLEGTVKYGGEDVQFAMILVQAGDKAATGKVGEGGRYRVENVPLGEVKIGVNTSAARGDFTSRSMSRGARGGDPREMKMAPLKFVDVPGKYADPETSGLKTTTSKGENTFDVVIPK